MFKSGTTKRELEQLGNSSTIIAKNALIDGNIETLGNLRLEGKITGNIFCKSKLVMSDTAYVQGNVSTQNAELAGKVLGNIEVADLLVLKSTAVIDGDITAGKIMVEAGATFNGKCKMGPSVGEITIGNGSTYREIKTA